MWTTATIASANSAVVTGQFYPDSRLTLVLPMIQVVHSAHVGQLEESSGGGTQDPPRHAPKPPFAHRYGGGR